METRLYQQMTMKKEKKMKINDKKHDDDYYESAYNRYPDDFYDPDDFDDYDENEKAEKTKNNFENNLDVFFETYDFLQRMTDYFAIDNNWLKYAHTEFYPPIDYDYDEGINVIIYKLYDVLFKAYGEPCLCVYVNYGSKKTFRGMDAFEALKFRGLENLQYITFVKVWPPADLDYFFDEWDPYTATGCNTETESFHIGNKDEPIVRYFDRYNVDDLRPCDPRI